MTKAVKKKNRKLRRQIRKTAGALLMITAITVAAVPVQDVSAEDPASGPVRVRVVNYKDPNMNSYEEVRSGIEAPTAWQSRVPLVKTDAMIYTTGSGQETGATFQFAYVRGDAGSTGDEIAVILGASVKNLDDQHLTIPDTVNAYRKYTANTSSSGYCAVNRLGDFLYYQTFVQSKDQYGYLLYRVPNLTDPTTHEPKVVTEHEVTQKTENGEVRYTYSQLSGTDEEGNPVYTDYVATPITEVSFEPCYYDQRSNWQNLRDDQMYWYDPSIPATSPSARMAYQMDVVIPEPTATPEPTMTPEPIATLQPVIDSQPVLNMQPTLMETPTPAIVMVEPQQPEQSSGIIMEELSTPTPSMTPMVSEATPEPVVEEPVSEEIPEPTPTSVISEDGTDSYWLDGLQTETIEKAAPTAMSGGNVINQQNMQMTSLLTSTATGSGVMDVDFTQTQRFIRATDRDHQWIHNADVRYIGRQRLAGDDGVWQIAPKNEDKGIGDYGVILNPELGVFAQAGNVEILDIGDNLLGIGDHAFYNCTALQSVTLGNGLNTIGNGAFAECANMKTCNLQLYSQITAIGMEAFRNCRGLREISMPVGVQAIGDLCFQGCSSLQHIELCGLKPDGERENVSLSVIGRNAFAGCSSLTSITFPDSFRQTNNPNEDAAYRSAMDGKIPVSYFEGCTSLQSICIQNRELDIIDGTDGTESGHPGTDDSPCDITTYLNTVFPPTFYFEGLDVSNIHDTAKDHEAAFKYLGENRFEKVVRCPEDDKHPSTFIVDNTNRLIEMDIPDECKVIVIPENIGGYGVSTISATSFQNNCFIEKIYIPASVNLIESNAFKGCHNLESVIFTQPENSQLVIQNNAFNTQDVGVHKTNCDRTMENVPNLNFTGTISSTSAPFQYAMNPANNINIGSQQANTYITYYSGWPTNLTVKYNWETGKNELLDYPRYAELSRYDEDSYPYMTEERVKAAQEAVRAYEDYLGNSALVPTQDQLDIVNSALNINLPDGIESIAEGIFSGVDVNNEPVGGSGGVVPPGPVDPGASPNPDASPAPTPGSGSGTLTVNKNIQTITMNTVETVEPYTFAGCSGLTGVYMAGGNEIGDYAFKNCEKLSTAEVAPSVSTIGVRPFAGCKVLTDVKFSGSPHFTCENSIIFATENGAKKSIVECLEARSGIINASELVGVQNMWEEAFKDCKGINEIDLSETKITDLPYQSFARSSVNRVILPDTTTSIQKGAFWNTDGLYSVDIPNNLIQIAANAFASVEEDAGEIAVDDDGNATVKKRTDNDKITFLCNDGSAANIYANMKEYNYIKASTYRLVQYLVIPPNVSGATPIQVGKTVKVAIDDLNDKENWDENKYKYEPDLGNSSRFPEFQYDGYHFEKWGEYTEANGQLQSYAQYSQGVVIMFYAKDPADPSASYELVTIVTKDDNFIEPNLNDTRFEKWHFDGYRFVNWTYAPDGLSAFANYANGDCTVTFVDVKNAGQRIVTVNKKAGDTLKSEEIPTPADMAHFTGWEADNGATIRDRIYEDVTFYAGYSDVVNPSPGSSTSPGPGGSTSPGPGGSTSPGPGSSTSPGTNPTERPRGTAEPTATPTATPNPGDNVTLYTASISGGSGSGRYPAGAVVSINAYYMGEGQLFDRWTSSTAGVGFANPNASSTTFTMPASNVAVTATYKTGSGSGSAAGSGGSGGGAGTGSGQRNTGSTVEITRPGISNTNLAGATVSGATDNFIIKVTEDQAATNAVTAALQARYGDLSRIKYFPMDISLYDSTGRVKIADTSGITVNLTLPLPDELVPYAGNNRVGAVANGALEDLGVRFTTVDGVPCVNFTATHFSPYVIYVDTANLTEGVIDATPQTGDPIHPKWFLSLGLACVSLILFFKRDKALNLKKA